MARLRIRTAARCHDFFGIGSRGGGSNGTSSFTPATGEHAGHKRIEAPGEFHDEAAGLAALSPFKRRSGQKGAAIGDNREADRSISVGVSR